MFEVRRAAGITGKVKVAIYRGTGQERTEVFTADTVVRFRTLPPEIEKEVTAEKGPRLVATEIPWERTPKQPDAPTAASAAITETDEDA